MTSVDRRPTSTTVTITAINEALTIGAGTAVDAAVSVLPGSAAALAAPVAAVAFGAAGGIGVPTDFSRVEMRAQLLG